MFLFITLKDIKLPDNEPHIKLTPIIKLTGKLTVSFVRKLTLDLFELFCIPTIRTLMRLRLKTIEKDTFFRKIVIYFFIE